MIEVARQAFTDGMFLGMGLAALTLAATGVMVRLLLPAQPDVSNITASAGQGVAS